MSSNKLDTISVNRRAGDVGDVSETAVTFPPAAQSGADFPRHREPARGVHLRSDRYDCISSDRSVIW